MGGGVLRAYVDYKVIFLENKAVFLLDFTLGILDIHVGAVALALILNRYGIELGRSVVVLAERIAHPVDAEEKAAHILVADEHDTEEVVDLTLENLGDSPYFGNGVEHRVDAVGGRYLDGYGV